MKLLVETSSNKGILPKKIFKPGWYSGYPHFDVSAPYTDGIGAQHLTFRVCDGPGCHSDAVGEIIGQGHVPSGYIMITKERLAELEALEKDSTK